MFNLCAAGLVASVEWKFDERLGLIANSFPTDGPPITVSKRVSLP